jgi:hypothetical protein
MSPEIRRFIKTITIGSQQEKITFNRSDHQLGKLLKALCKKGYFQFTDRTEKTVSLVPTAKAWRIANG